MKFKEKIICLKSKLRSQELIESKSNSAHEELLKKLKECEQKISDQENQITQSNEKLRLNEIQNMNAKQNFFKEMKNYEMKVKEIIDEMKTQKEKLEDESNKLVRELKSSKKAALDANENYKQTLQKLESKDQEILQFKSKLMEKCQLEDREKLLKRELDENLNQIRNYKSQILDLNLEKEKYFNRSCEQDIAIRHLLDEIKSLHNQLKILKQQATDQNAWNESICSSSNVIRPTISTPVSQSTTECLNAQSQSQTNYVININNRSIENNGDNDNYKLDEDEGINNSECDSGDENTIKKLAHLLRKDQSEYTNSYGLENKFPKKDLNTLLIADDFSRYLEEQLQLIKIAGERNLASIKRELK